MKLSEAEDVLELYTLEEIIDHNDLTEADVLCFLVEEEFLEIPEPQPLSFND